SRRRHTRCYRDWSSDVCSSDLASAMSEAAVATEARITARADVQRPGWLQRLVAHRTVVVGAAILLVILAVALLADVIATHVPTRSEERRVGKGRCIRWYAARCT